MDFSINGKPLSSLRVVDLKVELEKRGLPKSGNKNDLIERLSHYLMKHTQNQNMGHQESYPAHEQTMRSPGMGSPGAQPPNMSLSHGLADNDFVRDYLKMRETQFASAISDQDAHLQSNKVEQPTHQMVGMPGHVENQHMNNQVVAPIQNQIPMEKQGVIEPATNSLSYQEPVAPQKVATNQAVQQYGQMGASLHGKTYTIKLDVIIVLAKIGSLLSQNFYRFYLFSYRNCSSSSASSEFQHYTGAKS